MKMSDLDRLLEQNRPDRGRAGQAIDLSRAIETFILDVRAGGLADATVRWYSSLLNRYGSLIQVDDISTVTANDIREYIVSLKSQTVRYANAPQRPEIQGELSRSTITGHVTALHAFWKWAAREYGIPNPCQNVKRMRPPKPTPRAITAADFVRLFNTCGDDEAGDRNRAMLAFLADTGVRVSGLVGLRVDRLYLPEHQAVIIEKGDKPRIVVYTKYTRALLALWLGGRAYQSDHVWTSLITGEPLTVSGVDQLLKRLKLKAGITGRVNPHSFRHAFAREYLKAGGDAIRLAKLIGHSDVNTTSAYYAIFTPDELARMHEVYSPLKSMMQGGEQ